MIIHFSEIMDYLEENKYDYVYSGNKDIVICDFCSISKIKKESITWIKNINTYEITKLEKEKNLLIITNKGIDESKLTGYNIIACEYPKEVFFSILNHFFCVEKKNSIEDTSRIETNHIGSNVSVGHNCYIAKEVFIGNNVTICNNVVIECKTLIGDNSIIHSGVVIGTDGYGYYQDRYNNIRKVPHFGGVVIGKNVEIGSNTCIDRGTIDDTIIDDNVKIDNLCHIAHNVHIEENSYIIALSMIGGSSNIHKGAYIAPGVMVMNQISVGENSILGMGSVVTKDVENNKVVVGVPAKIIRENIT